MLISVESLYSRLGREDTVVFDCRFTLGKPDAGRNAYMQSHIPGAFYLDLEQDLSGRKGEHGGRHPLPEPQDLAEKLGAAGVGRGVLAVVYDAGEGMAPRAWWLLRYLGHDDVAVLDGGWTAWMAAGLPVTADLPHPQPRHFPLSVRTDWVVGVDDVRAVVTGDRPAVLIDARAPERYRGETEPLDPKAGHIPGAVNRPWQDGIGPDGHWRSAAEQRARFADLAASGQEIIAYCGSGVTACANLFALHLAGVRNAKLYPGSWSDWCSYPENPIAP